MTGAPMLADLRVSFDRLRKRLDALAEIGALPERGCARLALTDADRAGRDLVVTWMRDLGTRVEVDAIGNVVATWPPDRLDPPVLTGSHIDTVATGGIYDGCLGVLAGLEVLETVIASGIETERPLAVAFFTDEEGSRFHPDMLGSLVFAGGLPVEEALSTVGVDGAVLGEELTRIGYAGGAPCPGRPPHAYVELHIEQGPVLEAKGVTIGAVTSVQGISWTEVTVIGQSNHAGTTPMNLRHDAAYVAAAIAVFVRSLTDTLGP
ncbi:MAG: beta-ureidopropionase / N-carbamoyl-L-amino-acid hydrolase, partial [Actinomycetota bacterium]|nr:beta-ureidopropionase / N-carbamoyl-L-amino-acid hydrolase [Actinomycetota bacterium]